MSPAPSSDRNSPRPPSRRPTVTGLFPLVVLLLALVVLWFHLDAINQTDPWYRNVDMNIHNMADALSLNSGVPPNQIDQPAVPTKFLLAVSYSWQHFAGGLSVWNLERLDASTDPLQDIRSLIHALRLHSRLLFIAFLVCAAVFVWSVSRQIALACLAAVLLATDPAIAFHGLLSRPELLCVLCGVILAPVCLLRARAARTPGARQAWWLAAGLWCGFALLEKLFGVACIALICAWCGLSALQNRQGKINDESDPRTAHGHAGDSVPIAASIAMFWLLSHLEPFHVKLGEVALQRLRCVTLGIAILPLIALWPGRGQCRDFLVARAREAAAIGGGVLLSFLVTYLALRTTLSSAGASDYLARILSLLMNPAPHVALLADSTHATAVFAQHLRENAGMFAAAGLAALSLFFLRPAPPGVRLAVAMLSAYALGITALMSKRHHIIHYEIYYLAPLYLALILSLGAWAEHGAARWRRLRWLPPAGVLLACVVLVFSRDRIRKYYDGYLDDTHLPLSELTVTFIFDHDAKTQAYLDIMRRHYGDRAGFRQAADRFLADPAHRY